MSEKTIHTLENLRTKCDLMVALAGNPNVGKSSIFNSITGLGVMTANYAGKTVELNFGISKFKGKSIGVVDIPGTYSLDGTSEDQLIARRCLLENDFDVIIDVLDSTNLNRNLYLLLQLLELRQPVIAALNLTDQSEKKGLTTDVGVMEQILQIDIVKTSALRGDGIDTLIEAVIRLTENPKSDWTRKFRYGANVEEAINTVSQTLAKEKIVLPFKPDAECFAPLLLEGDRELLSLLKKASGGEQALAVIEKEREKLKKIYGETDIDGVIIKARYALAGTIVSQVQKTKKRPKSISEKLWDLSTDPTTALPALVLVFSAIIFILFQGGEWISSILEVIWTAGFAPPITAFIHWIAGEGMWAKILNWGLNDGMFAAIGVGIPYVLVFYLILSVLEDTGYLNSVAFLLDKALHSVGLHGKAFIPMSAAIGCSVPAVIGTRILGSKRERVIAVALIAIIACSARTAVIFGAVSRFIGFLWAISLILINILLVIVLGRILHKFIPGESEGLVMEVFPFRRPHLQTVLKKTWIRFADFLWIATPIVICGSMLLGYLYESGNIWKLTAPFKPIFEDWLGLPAVAGLTLLFAVLRKELALQFLITLAVAQSGPSMESLTNILTKEQIYTFTLFNTLYMPCIATIAVMGREVGWKWTSVIIFSTLAFTIIFTGIVHKFLIFTGWLA